MKRNKFKREQIIWVDSFVPLSEDGPWFEIADVAASIKAAPIDIVSVGVVVYESKTIVCLAVSAHDSRCSGCMAIPKCCIVKRRRLK